MAGGLGGAVCVCPCSRGTLVVCRLTGCVDSLAEPEPESEPEAVQ